ncbi:MAG: hypothetical protein RIC56_02295 [Pseudomonadales bacterium]
MKWILSAAAVTALLIAPARVQAAALITEVFQYPVGAEATELEVALDVVVDLQSPFASDDGRTFEARLTETGPDGLAWQMAELEFGEADDGLARVAVEGSSSRGFVVRVEFTRAMEVVTLPQHANNRVTLKYLDRNSFRRTAGQAAKDPGKDGRWAIDLGIDAPLLDIDRVPRSLLVGRSLYLAPQRAGNTRLGFFDRALARSVLRQVQGTFPRASVVHVTAAEADYGVAMQVNSERVAQLYAGTTGTRDETATETPGLTISIGRPGDLDEPVEAPVSELIDWQAEADDSLLSEAREAYIAGDYDRAIALYTKASGERAFRLEALEMLGVSREQNRQTAHAKRLYQQVLAEYPGTEAADRVDARLRALVSIDRGARTLRKPNAESALAWNVTGNVSQFYRRYSIDIDGRGSTVPINGLFTDASASAMRIGPKSSHEARLSVGHIQDFTSREGGRTFRVQEAYWKSTSEPLNAGIQIGRQRQRRSGVLGRFDGINASYSPVSNIELNVLGGYLLESSFDSPGTERSFWGVNAEFDMLDNRLSVVPFYVEQNYEGVVDRQAVGLQGEYYSERANYYGMVDYDLHHEALNHVYLTSNLRIGQETRFSTTIDHRRNPYLTTRNALIGQPLQDLSELELLLVEQSLEDSLEDLARDRSALSTMLRVSLHGSLRKGWAYSMDASYTDFDATESSLNVQALDPHQDFYYSAQIRADDLFGQGNYGSLQARYYDSDTSQSVGVFFNNRLAIGESWWLYPRLQVDQRSQLETDQDQLRVKPSLRLDYRYSRALRFELEAGYEWTDRDMAVGSMITQGIFIRAGYRAMF